MARRSVLLVGQGPPGSAAIRALVEGAGHGLAEIAGDADFPAAVRAYAPDIVLVAANAENGAGEPAVWDVLRHAGGIPVVVAADAVCESDAGCAAVAARALAAGARDFWCLRDAGRLVPLVEREVATVEGGARADRMAVLGVLAAGVVHEINNPLTAIIAGLDAAAACLRGPPSSRPRPIEAGAARDPAADRMLNALAFVDQARDAARRVRELLKDLRIYAHPPEEIASLVDVRQVVEAAIRLAWTELRQRARVEKDLAPVPPVRASEGRLVQVVLNLLVNAGQAIARGGAGEGTVRVTTRFDAPGAVVIEVCDSGPGIPDHVLPHVFEPFFTTKPAGEGTGLGLAICQRIVVQLGGDISADRAPGGGARFKVVLPAATLERAAS